MVPAVKHRLIILAAVAAATLAASPPSLAKLYKWIDADGNVTYSQQPPAEGQNAEEMELRGYESADPDAQENLDRLKDKADAAHDDREFADADSAASMERDERIKKNCEIARENLRVLQSSARVQETDAGGNLVYLDETGVQSKIEATQQQIKDYCG